MESEPCFGKIQLRKEIESVRDEAGSEVTVAIIGVAIGQQRGVAIADPERGAVADCVVPAQLGIAVAVEFRRRKRRGMTKRERQTQLHDNQNLWRPPTADPS